MSTILYRINYVSVLSFSIAHFYCKTYSFTLWDNPENNMAFQVLKDYKVLGRVVFFVQLSSFSPDPFLRIFLPLREQPRILASAN